MRVAFVTETFLPSVNGVATRLDQTVRHLVRGGDDVMVIAPGGGTRDHGGARIVGIGGFPFPLYREISVALPRPAVSRALKSFRADIIHVVNPAILGWGGIYYARTRRIPLLCSFHTHLPHYLQHYGLGVMENLVWDLLRSAHNQAAVNLCISRPMETELIEHGIRRVEVGWRGGVDTELFHPDRRNAETRARLCAADPEGPLLLYVGRLSAEKGVDRLRDVLDAIPGAQLAIAGDGPFRPSLERHFAGRPVVFPGYLRGEELARTYASADAFVFPSCSETLGLVLLEAMASGCPVVAARAGGIPEVVAEGDSGILFAPGNMDEAAGAVRQVLGDADLARGLREAGRAQAERWSWAAATSELRERYLELAGPMEAVA